MGFAIELDHLTKRYGSLTAVDGLSLHVPDGSVFGFLGPNGAGKTTTIRCMLGFITPNAGSVSLLGTRVGRDPGQILDRIGTLPGEFGLWPGLSGNDVLSYLGSLSPSPPVDRETLCERFELGSKDRARPVRTYSRGMRQKLGLIQAFQHRPELVILDEPTEGLDPLMQDRFLELLSTFTSTGGTVFMSSHILSEVEAAATTVGVIKRGRLIKEGSPEALVGEQIHRARLVLRDASASLDALVDATGVEELHREGVSIRFIIRGAPGPALREISRLDLLSCTVEPPRLAATFLQLYEDDGEDA